MDIPGFTIVLRGYDPAQVDELLTRTRPALASPDESLRAEARQALLSHDLPVRWRGYDREQVNMQFALIARALELRPPGL